MFGQSSAGGRHGSLIVQADLRSGRRLTPVLHGILFQRKRKRPTKPFLRISRHGHS